MKFALFRPFAPLLALQIAAAAPVAAQAPARDYNAAQLSHDATSLRGFHGVATPIRRSFRSDAEARGVLGRVLTAAGLAGMEDRIVLRASAETANAEATLENGVRIVFYNADFMQRVREATSDYWSMVAILAHEVGHHVRLHTVIAGRNHEFELEADYQAGFILRRMGATREQAIAAYQAFPEAATATHPGRAHRVQSVTLGWVDGGAEHGLPNAAAGAGPARSPAPPGPAVRSGEAPASAKAAAGSPQPSPAPAGTVARCAATAEADNGALGAGTGATEREADDRAAASCASAGGDRCRITATVCR